MNGKGMWLILIFGVPLTGGALDDLPSAVYDPVGIEEGVLWGVGRFDGRPADERAARVRGQYPRLTADGEVVAIRSVVEFPQVIRPGQSFVLHLGELPRANLVLRLALTSTFTAETEYFADPANRTVRILFNNNLIWQRWVVDGHGWIETYVPPPYVEAVGNVLVIENQGKQAMAFDALRLVRYEPGAPLMAALAGGHGQPGTVAAHLRQAVLRLDAPLGAPAGTSPGRVVAPRDVNEAVRAYRALRERPGARPADEAAAARRARWEAEIGAALRRGLWPVVEVRGREADEAAWRHYAQRYGGMVQAWIIHAPQAAEWVRSAVPDARIYGVGGPVAGNDDGRAGLIHNGWLRTAPPGLVGGRVDRWLGRDRAARWEAGRTTETAGMRLPNLPGPQPVPIQRRNGFRLAESLVNGLMAGGDLVVLDGGEPGGPLFPAVDGTPSWRWESVRPVFAVSCGRARRTACAVVPLRREGALRDTHWVAAENNDELVTLVLMPSRWDRGREVQIILPVPWQGATAGYVDGVQFGANWRTDDPEPLEPDWLELSAAYFRARRDGAEVDAAAHGHVILRLRLDGLTRVRFWPAGRTPPDRLAHLQRLPAAVSARPETLRGVFRVRDMPPPAGYRYELLRQPGWPSGPMGGAHTAEVRPATPGRFPAWRLDDRFHGRERVEIPGTVPWEEQSQFITFRPDGTTPHAFELFQADGHTWRGAWGMMVYARARLPEPPPVRRGEQPPSTVAVWMGSRHRRERVTLPLDEWRLVSAPFEGFHRRGEPASAFYLWPDDDETRVVEVELNGFTAVYRQADDGTALGSSQVAVRWSEGQDHLWMLVEGVPGKPAAQLMRLERPARIREARVAAPQGYTGVRVRHRPAAQWVEVLLPPLPQAADGVSSGDARTFFPRVRPDPERARVLLELVLEQ